MSDTDWRRIRVGIALTAGTASSACLGLSAAASKLCICKREPYVSDACVAYYSQHDMELCLYVASYTKALTLLERDHKKCSTTACALPSMPVGRQHHAACFGSRCPLSAVLTFMRSLASGTSV